MFEDSVRNVAFAIVRLSHFISGALLFGLVVVVLLVLRPAFAEAAGRQFDETRVVIGHRIESLVKVALVVSGTAALLALLLQSLLIADLGGGRLRWSDVSSVLNSSFGLWHALRIPLLIALGIVLGGRVHRRVLAGAGDGGSSPASAWWEAWGALAFAVLLTNSLSGHAAVSSPSAVALANDLTHLAAGGIWFAGIVLLAAVVPEGLRRTDPDTRLELLVPNVVNFSRLALGAIAVIGVTGSINSVLNLEAFSDLFDSGYGRALTVKLTLFFGILIVGGINHLYVRNRLRAALRQEDRSRASGLFRKTIAVELAFGLALFGVTGVLVGSARTRPVSAGVVAPSEAESRDQAHQGGYEKNEDQAHQGAEPLG
jgi:copper transport protein